jgi:ubiquinone/menaquinone biosynthesis C-methylase UbiE
MNQPQAMAHLAIYDRVEEILGKLPRGRLLDVPAGQGALAMRLKAMDFDVVCCDLYPQIFALRDIEIRRGDLDARLPYEDASFQYAVCIEGLEHIENPANAIRELSRVLAPAGMLIVSVPNIMNIEERFKWLLSGYTSHFKPVSASVLESARRDFPEMEEVALHVNPISYSELRYLLENNGFGLDGVFPDRVKRNTWAFLPFATLFRSIGKFSSRQKRRERWADELNSNEVLLGGNTLIFKATKL